MRAELVADGGDFAIRTVACAGGHLGTWSAPELDRAHGIVLVRNGRFRLRERGRELLAEPTSGYLQRPGMEREFAHPAGGDVCTAVSVSASFWHALPRTATPAPGTTVPVDGRLALVHLLLLRAARGSDLAFEVAERVAALLVRALSQPGPVDAPRPSRSVALAGAAREAILADDPAAVGLVPLAGRLGVSPYHLSRTFRAVTGVSLTRYRNRVRVSRALARIDAGASDLARLAAELGFADQAHLTRTVTGEVGRPPGALRRLLTGEQRRHRTLQSR